MSDARNRQGVQFGIRGNEIIRSCRGCEGEVQGVGRLHTIVCTQTGELFCCFGSKRDEAYGGGEEESTVSCGCEDVAVPFRYDEYFGHN